MLLLLKKFAGETNMKTTLECKNGFLCIVEEPNGTGRNGGYRSERRTAWSSEMLDGRTVTQVDPSEGTVRGRRRKRLSADGQRRDEAHRGRATPGNGETELEALLEASLNGRKATDKRDGPKRLFQKESKWRPQAAGVAGDDCERQSRTEAKHRRQSSRAHRRSTAPPSKIRSV